MTSFQTIPIDQIIDDIAKAESPADRQTLAETLKYRLKMQSSEAVQHAWNTGYAMGHSVGKEAVMNAVETGLMAAVGEIRKAVIGEPS